MPSEESLDEIAVNSIFDDLGICLNDASTNFLLNSYLSSNDEIDAFCGGRFDLIHSSPSQSRDSGVCSETGLAAAESFKEFQANDLPLLPLQRSGGSSSGDSRNSCTDYSAESYSNESELIQKSVRSDQPSSVASLVSPASTDCQEPQCFPCLILTQATPTSAAPSIFSSDQTLLANFRPNSACLQTTAKDFGPNATNSDTKTGSCDKPTLFSSHQASPTAPNQYYIALQPSAFKHGRPQKRCDDDDKRLEKMMKNRMSALLSRKRKKEQFEDLKNECCKLTDENNRLRRENHHLKCTIEALQSEIELWKTRRDGSELNSDLGSGPFKKFKTHATHTLHSSGQKHSITRGSVALLALMCLFVVNVGPYLSRGVRHFTTPFDENAPSSFDREKVHISKLISSSDKIIDLELNGSQGVKKLGSNNNINYTGGKRRKRSASGADFDRPVYCNDSNHAAFNYNDKYVNETRTIQLLEELNRWFIQHDNMRSENKRFNRFFETHFKSSKYTGRRIADSLQNYRINSALVSRQFRHVNRRNALASELGAEFSARNHGSRIEEEQLEAQYVAFLNAFGRRNDTLYVVSFREDYLLWRAKEYNRTSKLRMSLFMPALSINEFSGPLRKKNDLSMMQIECEILNLVQLPKVPSSVVTKGKNGRKIDLKDNDKEFYSKEVRHNDSFRSNADIVKSASRNKRKFAYSSNEANESIKESKDSLRHSYV